jgi:hypothetical protein
MINFTRVEYTVRDLKKQFASGEIDQDTFQAHLMSLVDIAPDGYYWMFGHESELWYRHNGQHWVQKDPGKLRMLEPSESAPIAASHVEPNSSTLNTAQSNLIADWQAIEWGWFITSIIIMGLIGWVVYTSI